MIDPQTAIKRCLKTTENESEIYVDMLSCFREVLAPEGTKIKTLDVLFRIFEIIANTYSQNAISDEMNAFPNVNFRYYLEPSVKTPFSNGLNFSQEFIQEMINVGISDAEKAINSQANIRERFQNRDPYQGIIYP